MTNRKTKKIIKACVKKTTGIKIRLNDRFSNDELVNEVASAAAVLYTTYGKLRIKSAEYACPYCGKVQLIVSYTGKLPKRKRSMCEGKDGITRFVWLAIVPKNKV